MGRIFSNADYEVLVRDVVQDAFYADNSYRDKISKERQYAEIVIRKILDIDPAKQITLGSVQTRLNAIPQSSFVVNAVNRLRQFGNASTHTQHLAPVSKEDYESVTDSLFDLLAYMLIQYFVKYRFGSNQAVLRAFSLLPPIIRHKVLEFLYHMDSENICVIDKYVLVMMKAEDAEAAREWVEYHREELKKMPAVSQDAYESIVAQGGRALANEVMRNAPRNMYEVCSAKVARVGREIDKKGGTLYRTFEEALPYYKENGIIPEDGMVEIQEFNDIMEFLYLGRKENLVQKAEDSLNVLELVLCCAMNELHVYVRR